MAVGRVLARKLAGLAVFLGALALLCAPAVSTESAAPVSVQDYEKLDLELARIGEEFDQYSLTSGERDDYVAMKEKRKKMGGELRVAGITGALGILGSLLSSVYVLKKKKLDCTDGILRKKTPELFDFKSAKARFGALSVTLLLSVALFLNGLVYSVKAAKSASRANKHRHELLVNLLRRYRGGRRVKEADFVTGPIEGEDGHVPD